MGCNQCRSRRNERNESKTEEKREKYRERKRKRKASLRGEAISSQAIGIILNLCNFIFHKIQFHSVRFHKFIDFILI